MNFIQCYNYYDEAEERIWYLYSIFASFNQYLSDDNRRRDKRFLCVLATPLIGIEN